MTMGRSPTRAGAALTNGANLVSQAVELSWHQRSRTGWREWIADLAGQPLRVTERRGPGSAKPKVVGLIGEAVMCRGHDVEKVRAQLVAIAIERLKSLPS